MKYIFLTIILLAITSVAYANGFGQTLDKAIGDYITNVDYDSFVSEIDPLTPVRFNFQLWNKERTEPVEFGDVWVRIAPQNGFGVLFAGTLGQPDFGPAGFSYLFQKGGAYELTARFSNKDKTLAEATFSLTVTGEESAARQHNWTNLGLAVLGGVVIGFALCFLFKKWKTP